MNRTKELCFKSVLLVPPTGEELDATTAEGRGGQYYQQKAQLGVEIWDIITFAK